MVELAMTGKFQQALKRMERGLQKAAVFVDSRGWLWLGIFLALYLATSWYRAERKLFWFDELFTLYISRLTDFHAILDVIKDGVDFNPPLFYALTSFTMSLAGDGPLGLRLPAIIGVGVLCLCLYRFVALRTSTIAGLVACLYPLTTGALFYSFEARPHGIILGFAGVALICWQAATDPGRTGGRSWWLVGLGTALAGACLTHVYGVLLFFPIVLGEITRTLQRRKVDWPVWVTFGFAMLGMLGPVWVYAHSGHSIPADLGSTSFLMLGVSYSSNVATGLTILLLVFLVSVFAARGTPLSQWLGLALAAPTRAELVCCLGFIALPVLAFSVALVTGAPYFARYSVSCVIGFAAVVGFLVGRSQMLALGMVIGLTLVIGAQFAAFVRGTALVEPSSSIAVSTYRPRFDKLYELLREVPQDGSAIALRAPLEFAPILHYAPRDLRDRLVAVGLTPRSLESGYGALIECCGAVGKSQEVNRFVESNRNFFIYIPESRLLAIQSFKSSGEMFVLDVDWRGAIFSFKADGLPRSGE